MQQQVAQHSAIALARLLRLQRPRLLRRQLRPKRLELRARLAAVVAGAAGG